MPRFTNSLRARLVLSGVIAVLLAAGAVAAVLGTAFERTVVDAFDRRLTDDLAMLAGLITADAGGAARLRSEPLDARYAKALSGHYSVARHGSQVFRSRSLWDADLSLTPGERAPGPGQAVALRNIAGPLEQTLRTASQAITLPGVDGPVYLLVASDVSDTLNAIVRFRILAALAGAIVAAALVLALFVQTSYGLRPLWRIHAALETFRRGESQQLDGRFFPAEIRPLAEELNSLLRHHERMVVRARTGAGDLAHALKTPMSVLLAAAERRDTNITDLVGEQVQRMRTSIDRHLSVTTPVDSQARANVAAVASSLQRMLAQVYRERALEFEFRIDPGLCFHGSADDLEEMLGNLLDNACKWAHHKVGVAAEMPGHGVLRISVTDDGPGIADDELEGALARGARLDEKVPGSGFGLSIVATLAASYGGEFRLDQLPHPGLRAILQLPGSHPS